MDRLPIKGNAKYVVALLLSSAILLMLLVDPDSAVGLEVTFNEEETDKGAKPGDAVSIVGEVSLESGETQEITGIKLFITGPGDVDEEVDLPFSPDPPINDLDLSEQLNAPDTSSLEVSMEALPLVPSEGGIGYGYGYSGEVNGYGYTGPSSGGAWKYTLSYTPPVDELGAYTVRIEVNVGQELFKWAETTFSLLGQPHIEVLNTIYPVAGGQVDRTEPEISGSNEAIPGDLVILQVSTEMNLEDVASVTVSSGSNAQGDVAAGLEFIATTEFHPVLLAKWDVSSDAEYILPVRIPGLMLTEERTVDIELRDNADQPASGSAALNIVSERSSFASYLMPGLNFLSTPLQSAENDATFSIEDLLAQDVSEYVGSGFLAGLNGTALLSDVVTAIFAYDPVAEDFLVYTPGNVPDNLSDIAVGRGYIFNVKEEAFNQLGSESVIPQPIPMIFIGETWFDDTPHTPLTFPVAEGWNLVGPHTETNTPVDRFLAPLNAPERTWESLYDYLNSVEVRTLNGAVQGDPADSLEYINQQFRGRFGGRPGVVEGDQIRVGSALWLFTSEDDWLSSVLDLEVAENGED